MKRPVKLEVSHRNLRKFIIAKSRYIVRSIFHTSNDLRLTFQAHSECAPAPTRFVCEDSAQSHRGAFNVQAMCFFCGRFTCAASFHVFTSQLKSVFGLPLTEFYGPFKIIKVSFLTSAPLATFSVHEVFSLQTYVMFFSIVKDTNIPAFVVGLICFIFLVIVKMGINDNRRIMRVIRIPIPAELIIVIFATLASYLMDLNHVYKVPIVKHIPEGLPPPTLPDMKILTSIIGDTFSNAIVGLAITVTLGMLYASKHGKFMKLDFFYGCGQLTGNLDRPKLQISPYKLFYVIVGVCYSWFVWIRIQTMRMLQ